MPYRHTSYMSDYQSMHQSYRSSHYLSIHPCILLSVHFYLCIHPYIFCLSIYLASQPAILLCIHPYVCVSILLYPCIHPSILYLCIHLCIYLFIHSSSIQLLIHPSSVDPSICPPNRLGMCQSLSRVRRFATPWTVARQAPPCMGFSRQERWSGLPFPPPGVFLTQGLKSGLLVSSLSIHTYVSIHLYPCIHLSIRPSTF